MAHKEYKVKKGDSIASIAFERGLLPETIWDDPKNKELKDKREESDILMVGDIVYIREKEETEESCATQEKHRFRRKNVPAKLELQLLEEGQSRDNLEYQLIIDGIATKGKTDKDGWLKHSIPPNAKKGELKIGDSEVIDLEIGHLDPITTIEGVQQRLNNLAFNCGEPSGKLDEKTSAAIRSFQQENDLEATGKPDKKTESKLMEVHGS